MNSIDAADLLPELVFKASRSGGPGGQNVNKVNSKVTLKFSVTASTILTAEQKELLSEKWGARLTREGFLVIMSQETRSQIDNKALTIARLDQLLTTAFTKERKRKATRPGKAARQKRLTGKKQNAEKKRWRQKPD